ncbi:MAG: twitch domain-containing radical SAM protein [Elusimicrobiota bacterium]
MEIQAPNGAFCMAPWTRLHVKANGDALPCCEWRGSPFGNIRKLPLEQIRSGKEMIQVRQKMIDGVASAACSTCYEFDRRGLPSFRRVINEEFAANIPAALKTSGQDSPQADPLRFLTIEFSNLCNYRCRTCGIGQSSAWLGDALRLAQRGVDKLGSAAVRISLSNFIAVRAGHDDFRDILEPLLPHLDTIHFMGGEPLIMPEHYEFLNHLIERKIFHIKLLYHSNFSVTKFRDYDVFKMWKMFQHVQVIASLDAMGRRAEYMRKGQRWPEIERNREFMLRACPEIWFRVMPTLSIMNAMHLPDFHRRWVEKQYIAAHEFSVGNILLNPKIYRAQLLPTNIKNKVVEKYHDHIDRFLKPFGHITADCRREFLSAADFVSGDGDPDDLKQFKKITSDLDEIRGERFVDVFPELAEVFS